MLNGIRVLEVSARSTMYAGQLLADFGASVVLCEEPSGSESRRVPPFAGGRPGLDGSLLFMACNRGKRSCTLDVTTVDGAAIFSLLTAASDVILVDERHPARELLAEASREAEPGQREPIVCTIRPFSQSGPKRHYEYTELVLLAASGAPGALASQKGRPLFFPHPQSIFEVGVDAVMAILATLFADCRQDSARGEVIEVSARGASVAGAFADPLIAAASRGAPSGQALSRSGERLPSIYRCTDGFALISLIFGTAYDQKMVGLARWLCSVGVASADLAGAPFSTYADLDISDQRITAMVSAVAQACARSTRRMVTEAAASFGFFGAPILDTADIIESERLAKRGVLVPVQADDRQLRMPVRFARISGAVVGSTQRPPSLGADTFDVLQADAGLTDAEICALFAQGIV